MIDIAARFRAECSAYGFPFDIVDSPRAYDDTTLFCPAGMQKYKAGFGNPKVRGFSLANIQPCIRTNDLDSLGDGTHLALFNMMGLFSFRDLTIEAAIYFWVSFLSEINVKIDYATVHPNRINWAAHYIREGVTVKTDSDCEWSDGKVGGYCTEFYYKGVEIGNIVNPSDTCIDAGFGLERLDMLVNGMPPQTEAQSLISCATSIIDMGIAPSNVKQGYVLRKLLRRLNKIGGTLDHPFFVSEKERQDRARQEYDKLKAKYPDAPASYFWETHGIDVDSL